MDIVESDVRGIRIRYDVTADELVDIYKMFCEAFNYPFKGEDESFLRTRGIDKLRNEGKLDYYPNISSKEVNFELAVQEGILTYWCYNTFEQISERTDEWQRMSNLFRRNIVDYLERKGKLLRLGEEMPRREAHKRKESIEGGLEARV